MVHVVGESVHEEPVEPFLHGGGSAADFFERLQGNGCDDRIFDGLYVGPARRPGCRALEGGDQLIFDKELRGNVFAVFLYEVCSQAAANDEKELRGHVALRKQDGPRRNFPKRDSPHQLLEIFIVERKTPEYLLSVFQHTLHQKYLSSLCGKQRD